MRTTCKATLTVFMLLAFSTSAFAGTDYKHFHPKGKMPSKYTIEAQKQQRKILPFSDKSDFEEAKRGFIAAPDYKQIMGENGKVVWDIGSWEWLLDGKDFNSDYTE